MPDLTLTAADGHTLGAYRADPDGDPRGAIVVIQEIFGVNSHIREVCDRLAADGYVAIAPALFDRMERDFQSGYSPEEVEVARMFIARFDWNDFVRDTDAARAAVADIGKVGIVGFCMGGTVAFVAATRLAGLAAASGYYGGRTDIFAHETPRCPTQLHFGSEDQSIPMASVETVQRQRPDVDVFVYEGAGHGFHCKPRPSFYPEASKLAWSRTMDFFAEHVG